MGQMIPLRKILHSLKCRKLRWKHRNALRKSVPVSSVLHSLAAHYKWWNIRYSQREDTFYRNYFIKTKRLSVRYINTPEKNILQSGDSELNLGPA